ncbi:MAG: type II secretion system F family protein [Verrucomicrobiota bacterium]
MTVIIAALVFLSILLMGLAFGVRKQKKVSLVSRIKSAQAGEEKVGIRDAEKMNQNIFARFLLPLANKGGGAVGSFLPAKMVQKADQAIGEAGMIGQVSGLQILTLSWIFTLALPVFGFLLGTGYVLKGETTWLHLIGVCALVAGIGYRLPIGVIQGKAQKRKKEIQLALPFSFDLISISVSAGMAFDGAMATVSERTSGAFSEELKRTLREINLGISRDQALNNLATRTGVEDLKSFITAVNYISKLGGNITEVIEVQTEALRTKRRQRAEEKANQAPVKIMIPLVLFILPCVFVVILVPAGLRMML